MVLMSNASHSLAVYLHLARASALRRQPLVTDKLLVLSAAVAWELNLVDAANRCQAFVRARNPQHLLKNWQTFEPAYHDERLQSLLKQLRRQYSPEKAEYMLGLLGIELGEERALYASDAEYAAALLEAIPRAEL
jgi:hypothetical protein